MNIPFFDLKRLHLPYQAELNAALLDVAATGWFVRGAYGEAFEQQLGQYLGVKSVIGVGNGLDALTLILKGYKALGMLQDGDEVIVPAHTYIATVLAVTENGLKPILVEPEEGSYNIDVSQIEQHFSPRTKVILTVNLYGQLSDLAVLKDLCDREQLLLIEDNAQAIGAVSDGRRSGTFGHAAGFSFYPTKNLGAMGDGGAVATNDAKLAQMVRTLSNYGSEKKYKNQYQGVNSRLDEMQAAVLSVKLPYLDDENERRRAIAQRFCSEIKNPKIILPQHSGDLNHVWHVFVIRVKERDSFMSFLSENGVSTQIHYPIAIHKQEAYGSLHHLSLPLAERLAAEVVSLPMAPYLSPDEVTYIIDVVNRY